MTGIVGGTVDEEELGRMIDALEHEAWYDSDRFEAGVYGIGTQHHGKKDPRGYAFWSDGQTAGTIDGSITNLTELGWDVSTVFERLLRAPERTLETLEGPFIIACINASDDRIILGTDKIGCRPCYYTAADGFFFGSGLAPLLEVIDDPTVDEQGVSDLLLMGHLWSDTTLLEEVSALHPSTVLEYHGGRITKNRYWHPNYEPAPPTAEYIYQFTNKFQRAITRSARSMEGDVGLWLSGGLDSRSTASELAKHLDEFGSFTTYTYDSNPPGGVNPKLAAEVADALSVPNETVAFSPEKFLPVMEKAVDLVDGMVKWNTILNLSAVFNIEQQNPDIIMEGLEGSLAGHHLYPYHFTRPSSLVESMYLTEASLSTEEVEELLNISVDPFGSFRKEARRIDETSFRQAVVDVHFQNYYSRLAHASNTVPRSQAGTRVLYADGEFLSHVARMPPSYRVKSIPFSNGKMGFDIPKLKLELIRNLSTDLARIPYERTRLKPTYPLPLHIVGFFVSTAVSQLKSQPTYGGKSQVAEWYRTHDRFRHQLDGLIESACERSYFDADAVRDAQQRVLREESEEIGKLSSITTLEIWLQRHLD